MKAKKQSKGKFTTIAVRLINTEKPTAKLFTYLAPVKHGLTRGDYVAVPARGTPMLGIVIRIDTTPHFEEDRDDIEYISIIGKVQEIPKIDSVHGDYDE